MSSSSVNKVILVGNLAADPEIHSMGDSGRVASFSIATSEKWSDKETNTKKEKTQFHRVSVFNQAMVEVTEKYLHKGDKIYLEGQLENHKWTDKDWLGRGLAPCSVGSAYLLLPVSSGSASLAKP